MRVIKLVMNWIFALASLLGHGALILMVSATIIHRLSDWPITAFVLNAVWLTAWSTPVLSWWDWLMQHPQLAKRIPTDPKQFEKGYLKRLHKYGMFPMALALTWIGTPLIASVALKVFRTNTRRSWVYAIVSNVIISSAAVALYHGGAEVVRSLLHLHGSS